MSFHQTCTNMTSDNESFTNEFNKEETLKIKDEFKRLKGMLIFKKFILMFYVQIM